MFLWSFGVMVACFRGALKAIGHGSIWSFYLIVCGSTKFLLDYSWFYLKLLRQFFYVCRWWPSLRHLVLIVPLLCVHLFLLCFCCACNCFYCTYIVHLFLLHFYYVHTCSWYVHVVQLFLLLLCCECTCFCFAFVTNLFLLHFNCTCTYFCCVAA